jgi:hypothetical protein|tara:strand:+ start:17978 stop:18580 length:603 start_codon:yes stop_codon:yes gene_type:complete
MIGSKDFNAIRVENSDTEFVVVAHGLKGFVPVIASDNCSVDLMGFSASKGNVPKEMRDKERLSSYVISSDIEEYHQVEVDLDEGPDSSVYFYWKGTMPDDKGEFLHTCKSSLRQIFDERDSWKDANQEFFGWHLGPIVHQIERQNVYRALEKKRHQQNRKRSETLLTMISAIGAVVVGIFAVGVSTDVLDTIRSWLASAP